MAETTDNSGNPNIEYDDLWRKRPDRKRTMTDLACLFIYGVFIVVWISIAIYAYSNSNVSPVKPIQLVLEFVWENLLVCAPLATFFFTWLCVLLIVLYFIMIRWCTKFTVYLIIFLEFLFITLLTIAVGFKTYSVIVLPILLFSYAIIWIEIQILKKAQIHTVCKIIIEACKAIMAFPSSLLVALLCLYLTASLCMFTATVIMCLINAKPVIIFEKNVESYVSRHSLNYYVEPVSSIRQIEKYVNNTGLIISFLILSGWILLVNYLCMLFTLHGMFTSWCRMPNKTIIPKFTIFLHHLFYAYRFHIGSFAFMTVPFVPIIQVVRTINTNIHILRMRYKEIPYNIYCLFIIIWNIIENASVVCASYGESFYPSTKDAFKVLIQNPMKFAASRLVVTGIIFFGLFLIPGILFGLGVLHTAIWNSHYSEIYVPILSSTIASIITSGILFIFSAAVDSVLFCHLEELLKNQDKSANEDLQNNQV